MLLTTYFLLEHAKYFLQKDASIFIILCFQRKVSKYPLESFENAIVIMFLIAMEI